MVRRGADRVGDGMIEAIFPPNWHGSRCGHNFEIANGCPYEDCAAQALVAALTNVEAVMSIVPPRGNIKEYLAALDHVRAVLKLVGER